MCINGTVALTLDYWIVLCVCFYLRIKNADTHFRLATKDVVLERKIIRFQFDVFALNLMLLCKKFDVFEMSLAGNTVFYPYLKFHSGFDVKNKVSFEMCYPIEVKSRNFFAIILSLFLRRVYYAALMRRNKVETRLQLQNGLAKVGSESFFMAWSQLPACRSASMG